MVEKEIREDLKNNTPTKARDEYRVPVTERAKAVAFLKSANKKKYGKLLTTIREQHSFKIDVYPRTLLDAYEMLSSHVNSDNNGKTKRDNRSTNNTESENVRSMGNNNNNRSGASYLQTEAIPGTDGCLIHRITCFSCNKKGHYSDNCPDATRRKNNEEQHMQTMENMINDDATDVGHIDEHVQHMQMTSSDTEIIHFSWNMTGSKKGQPYEDTDILLDTGSTFSVFKNPEMVLNIRNSPHTLKAYTNSGRQDLVQVADVPGFFTVWFNPNQ